MQFPVSSISKLSLEGRDFYVKRDDIIDTYLSGNKYRKLYTLLQTPSKQYNTIISYGGTQSNAMLAIARMCQDKSWNFYYYTKPLSDMQKAIDSGNFFLAKKLGMNHIEIALDEYKNYIAALRVNLDEKSFIVDQGGATKEAKVGVMVLAKEIKAANLELKSVATPSGTGTTALFLALALPEFTVYTIPCVGDVEYLKQQMSALHDIPDNLVILEPKKKYHFAKPYKEFIEIQQNLLKAGIEFDLLYAPSLWLSLIEQTKEDILYIHSGGVTGNLSMLERYKKKGYY